MLDGAGMAHLMPMHLALSAEGAIISHGPTLGKLFPDQPMLGRGLFDLFSIRRPGGVTSMAGVRALSGRRLHLCPLPCPDDALRGLVVPLAGGGVVMNLSFGIGVIDAVRHHGLTDADFAATDLTVELLYLVEAKSMVMEELRGLNLRLQGAKIAAEEQALTDTLTGLRNRRAADAALAALCKGRRAFGLMQMDLDYFKTVNDTYGHAAGDQVLRRVAQVLTDVTRAGDCVARLGGDEFLLLFPGLADPATLLMIGRRIIEGVSRPIVHADVLCHVSASIGLVTSRQFANPSPEAMIEEADTALYQAKKAGRGRVQPSALPLARG